MKKENAIGLLGIGAWLAGVLFVCLGQTVVFDTPLQVKPEGPSVTQGPQCTLVYPRGFKVTKVSKKRPSSQTCTNGDFGYTWRECTPRFQA